MKLFSAAVILVVVAVAGGAFWLERQSNAQLREEVGLLRSEVQQLAKQREDRRVEVAKNTVAGQNAQAAQTETERAELARLRDEVNALKVQTKQLAAAPAQRPAGGSPADALPVKLIPVNEWKNAGRGTPAAAIETLLFAASGADVESLAGSLELTPSAREKAQALLDRLPEATREQYGTPEKLMALMLARDAEKLAGMQVLGQREVAPDTTGVRVRFGNDMGQTKEESLLMHRANDGWHLMLTDAPVEKFAKQLGGGK
jgi:hypothetical protein